MAQLSFDTEKPEDVSLLRRIVEAGLLEEPTLVEPLDLDAIVARLMSSVSEPLQDVVAAIVWLVGRSEGVVTPTTLAEVAERLKVSVKDAKARKMSLGRSVKKIQRDFPGLPDPIISKFDTARQATVYTLSPAMHYALYQWLVAAQHPLFSKSTPEVPDAV